MEESAWRVLALGADAAARANIAERTYASACAALENEDLRGAAGLFALLAILRTSDARPWLGLAALLAKREKYEAALGLFDLALLLDPEHEEECELGRAQVLAALGERGEAGSARSPLASPLAMAELIQLEVKRS